MDEQILSVIIPAYNAEKHLEEAVRSVRAQEPALPCGMRIEIIVADDGSADGTAALAERLGCIVLKGENRGAGAARNAAIARAKGSLFFLLDADDVVLPGAFGQLLGALAADGDALAVFAKAEDFVTPGLSAEEEARFRLRPEPYGKMAGASLIRRALFEKIGLFNEALRTGETVEWMMRLRDSGFHTAEIGAVTLKRRLHPENTGVKQRREEFAGYAALLRARMKKK